MATCRDDRAAAAQRGRAQPSADERRRAQTSARGQAQTSVRSHANFIHPDRYHYLDPGASDTPTHLCGSADSYVFRYAIFVVAEVEVHVLVFWVGEAILRQQSPYSLVYNLNSKAFSTVRIGTSREHADARFSIPLDDPLEFLPNRQAVARDVTCTVVIPPCVVFRREI